MLRVRILQTRPEEPQTGRHTAELIDDDGGVAAVGHVIADADVSLGGEILIGLAFRGHGTLGNPDAI